MGAATLSGPDFVWLIDSLCHINRLPFHPAQVLQRFSFRTRIINVWNPKRSVFALVRAIRRRLFAERSAQTVDQLRVMQMPVIDGGHT